MLAFRLAAHLGILDAERVYATLKRRGRLKRLWKAYLQLEPFGFEEEQRRWLELTIQTAQPTTEAGYRKLRDALRHRNPYDGERSRKGYMTASAFKTAHKTIRGEK